MTKRQLIDEIVAMNQTAEPAFLAKFPDTDLDAYLHHLQDAQSPRLVGDPRRFDHYFITQRPFRQTGAGCRLQGLAGNDAVEQPERDALLKADQPAEEAPQEDLSFAFNAPQPAAAPVIEPPAEPVAAGTLVLQDLVEDLTAEAEGEYLEVTDDSREEVPPHDAQELAETAEQAPAETPAPDAPNDDAANDQDAAAQEPDRSPEPVLATAKPSRTPFAQQEQQEESGWLF